MMPVIGASRLLAAWSQDPTLKGIPVVLTSAAPELNRLAQQWAVRATLAKPFDLDVLRVILEQLLGHPEPPPDTPAVTAD